MKKRTLFTLFILASLFSIAQNNPAEVNILIKAYPTQDIRTDGNNIYLKDSIIIPHKDIAGIFSQPYRKGEIFVPGRNEDPGRIRSEELLKAMYGSTAKEVEKNLTTITWCPKLVGSKVRVSRINGADKQLQKISDELDKHPELKKYLTGAGTYNWRKIAGTDRLSAHSFGIAIDLNIKYSHYWQWDCRCKNEDVDLKYKNLIPQKIVDIFEKHGFIWGGKWYHYDTMHFEYRPELLTE